VFWLSFLLTSPVVLVLGWWCVRADAPLGRLLRRLKRLLWLSIASKAGIGVAAYTMGKVVPSLLGATALIAGAALVFGEFRVIFGWAYPVEKAQRSFPASRGDYLRMRLRLVWESLAPFWVVGLGALAFGDLQRGAYHTGGLLATGAIALGVGLIRRPLPLPVRSVPVEAHLLAEAQRMGRELGVTVREILVLDGTRLRTANAFALSGGRIAITDYLLASLTELETLAVLAHEVAHLAQRRRLIGVWARLLSVGLGTAIVYALLWERLPLWGVLVWVSALAAGMTQTILRHRQRHEHEADAFAVSQFGVEPLESALRKIATIHQRSPHTQSSAVHPALATRLQRLRHHARN
jgi:Zn-dependent protease with chaperone function